MKYNKSYTNNVLGFINRSRHFRQTGSTSMCAKIVKENPNAVLVVSDYAMKRYTENEFEVPCISITDVNSLCGRYALALVYDKTVVEDIVDVLQNEMIEMGAEAKREMGRMEEYICSLKAEIYEKDRQICNLKELNSCKDEDLLNALCKVARLQESLTKIEKTLKEREKEFKVK